MRCNDRYSRVKGEDRMPNARSALVLVVFLMLGGCVPGGMLTDRHTMNPDQIAAIYIPTIKYDGYTCTQLAAEMQSTNAIIADMSTKLAKGEYDKSGSLVVTPLFLMYDNTSVNDETPKKAQELGRLKG